MRKLIYLIKILPFFILVSCKNPLVDQTRLPGLFIDNKCFNGNCSNNRSCNFSDAASNGWDTVNALAVSGNVKNNDKSSCVIASCSSNATLDTSSKRCIPLYPNLTYGGSTSFDLQMGVAISPIILNKEFSQASCNSSGSLPPGITITETSTTCILQGTPSAVQPSSVVAFQLNNSGTLGNSISISFRVYTDACNLSSYRNATPKKFTGVNVLCIPNQFPYINTNSTTLSESYVVGADISFTGPINNIGNTVNPFTGTFNGLGHTLSGYSHTNSDPVTPITVNSIEINNTTEPVGLFGNVSGNAVISDFTINGIDAETTSAYAGTLAGTMSGSPIFKNIILKGRLDLFPGSVGNSGIIFGGSTVTSGFLAQDIVVLTTPPSNGYGFIKCTTPNNANIVDGTNAINILIPDSIVNSVNCTFSSVGSVHSGLNAGGMPLNATTLNTTYFDLTDPLNDSILYLKPKIYNVDQ